MNRLRIEIKPYASFRGNPWRRLDTPRWYARRSKALAAVAIVVAIVVLLLSGCGERCERVSNAAPIYIKVGPTLIPLPPKCCDRIEPSEWDRYGCSRD